MIVTPAPSPEYQDSDFITLPTGSYYQTFAYPSPVMSDSAIHHRPEGDAVECYRHSVAMERTPSSRHSSQQPYLGAAMTAPSSRYSASPSIASTLPTSGLHLGLDRCAVGYSDIPYPSTKFTRGMHEYPVTVQPAMLGKHPEQSSASYQQGSSVSSSSEFPALEHLSYPSTSSGVGYSPATSMANLHPELLHTTAWPASAPGWEHMEPCHLAITNEHSTASQDGEGSVDSRDDNDHDRRSSSILVKQDGESSGAKARFAAGRRRASLDGPDRRVRRQRTQWTPPEKVKYTCEICTRGFSRQWNYRIHKETHQHDSVREKPHKCEHPGCELSFRRPTDLKRHQTCVHIKSKDFKCRRCAAGFPRKDSLQRHEQDGCPRRLAVRRRKLTRTKASAASAANANRTSSSKAIATTTTTTDGSSLPLGQLPLPAAPAPYVQEFRIPASDEYASSTAPTSGSYRNGEQHQHHRELHPPRQLYGSAYGPTVPAVEGQAVPALSSSCSSPSPGATAAAYPGGRMVSAPQWRHMPWFSSDNRIKEEP